jgi:hypothetical protein
VTEENPIAVPQQRRDNASFGKAFRGDRHRRIVPPAASRPCRAGRLLGKRIGSAVDLGTPVRGD